MNLENKTLLITGIDEFVGLRTAELAIAKGMKVRGLQTSTHSSADKVSLIQKLGAEVIVGDVTDKAVAQKICQGVDIVLHTAQVAKEAGSIDEFRHVNVDGTINIATAAKNAGVKTFIQLSSVLVYGFNYPNHVTEEGAVNSENNPYCQSKIEAETAVLGINSPPDFGVIIIRAGDVYGPGSVPWIVRPLLLMNQKLFAYADEGNAIINHVYVDNLINAIFLAMEKETYGEAFNITDGKETTSKEYFTLLAETANLPLPFPLAKDEIKLFITLRAQGQKLFRKKVDILPEAVDFMNRPHAYSIAKAKSILGYEPDVSLEDGLKLTKEWVQKTDLKKFVQ